MIARRTRTIVLVAASAAMSMAACGSHRAAQPALPPGRALVVLLPDPETGAVGRAIVTNDEGTTNLAAARDATMAATHRAPDPASTLPEADVRQIFGETLAALPPSQLRYTLFFRFDSEELTDESRATAAEIVRTVMGRPVPDVLIVGHTDTTGARAGNFELGLRRANAVRTLLRQAGLEPSSLDVVSHGETELLVPTANGVFEPKNRRVEITVR
jgi:outer membrane protein OmpA-like peptidoglycan-associated protein